MSKAGYSLEELAERLNAKVIGDRHKRIEGLATLRDATHRELSFLANPRYRDQLATSQAGAILLDPTAASQAESQIVSKCARDLLVVENPYLAYALASQLFSPPVKKDPGIHPRAIIDNTATIGEDVSIGANVVIEAGAVVGDRTMIEANCVIGRDSQLGSDCWLRANVTLYHDVKLGRGVSIHSGTIVGSDGFGYANAKNGWEKIAQLGRVMIGDDVEIGANTCIDRGALNDTVIEKGVIIDNQVQIAHNVRIGEYTAIAGCVGISGSTEIGAQCTIAGAAGLAGHLKIADNVHLGMQAQVTQSLPRPGAYASGTGLFPAKQWRRLVGRLRQLDRRTKADRVVKNQEKAHAATARKPE